MDNVSAVNALYYVVFPSSSYLPATSYTFKRRELFNRTLSDGTMPEQCFHQVFPGTAWVVDFVQRGWRSCIVDRCEKQDEIGRTRKISN